MQILTTENEFYPLNIVPNEIRDDIRFSVLDNSDPENPDHFFHPLMFLECFTGPAAVLRIGKHEIMMPLSWSTVVGDPESTDLEVLPFTSLNDRGFMTFVFNPISSFRPEFMPVDIVDIKQDVQWYFPKLKPGCLLASPLEKGTAPLCAYFVKEVSKAQEIISYTKCW